MGLVKKNIKKKNWIGYSIFHSPVRSYQSRIHIRRESFFFTRFFWGILSDLLRKRLDYKKKVKRLLGLHFDCSKIELVGQCRDGVFLSVKYAVDILKKKEVLISPYTLYQVVNMIILAGGKPVFVDLKEDSLEIDINSLRSKKTDETGCIILTHLTKVPIDILKIKSFAKKNNILLIEDCAVAFGKENVGSYGDLVLLSFQAMKNIQSIVGGAIICKDRDFYAWLKKEMGKHSTLSSVFLYKKLAFIWAVTILTETPFIKFLFFQILKMAYRNNIKIILKIIRADHEPKISWSMPKNSIKKMANIQAKFIEEGLLSYAHDVKFRAERTKIYFDKLRQIKHIKLLGFDCYHQDNHLEFQVLCERRNELFDYLLQKNIDVRKFYYRDISQVNEYEGFGKDCLNCSKVEDTILTLPCYAGYSLTNVKNTIDAIDEFYKL
tara:strand:- start:489 stop:1796 length:1308 start_codon:yes stop_codon:yes gene_type:complete